MCQNNLQVRIRGSSSSPNLVLTYNTEREYHCLIITPNFNFSVGSPLVSSCVERSYFQMGDILQPGEGLKQN